METPVSSQIWHISISRVYEKGVFINFDVRKTGTTYIFHDLGNHGEVIYWDRKNSFLL